MRESNIASAWVALVMLACMLLPYPASAKPEFLGFFLEEYPAAVGTRLESCNVCHIVPPTRNPYGKDYNLSGRFFPAIESTDSDGDGFDNLAEITALTFPGNPEDFPGAPPSVSPTRMQTRVPTPTRVPTDTRVPTNTPLPTNTRIPLDACYGDCNENGVVAINELVLGVNIALGSAVVEDCPKVDRNGDGKVTIDELLTAVRAALEGCPDV